jgi:hypothetical protein
MKILAGRWLIRKAIKVGVEHDGKIATPVPREGCAEFSAVPILTNIVRIGTSVRSGISRRVTGSFRIQRGVYSE